MPSDAPTPVPTITAVGVASPRAHGHAMTTTLIENSSANRNTVWPSGSHEVGYSPAAPAHHLPPSILHSQKGGATETQDLGSRGQEEGEGGGTGVVKEPSERRCNRASTYCLLIANTWMKRDRRIQL